METASGSQVCQTITHSLVTGEQWHFRLMESGHVDAVSVRCVFALRLRGQRGLYRQKPPRSNADECFLSPFPFPRAFHSAASVQRRARENAYARFALPRRLARRCWRSRNASSRLTDQPGRNRNESTSGLEEGPWSVVIDLSINELRVLDACRHGQVHGDGPML